MKRDPNWVSAKIIRDNLIQCYQSLASFDDSIEVLELPFSDQNDGDWVLQLRQARPDKLIFLESIPVPVGLLSLIDRYQIFRNLEIGFHIYGDFTIFSLEWLKLFCKFSVRKFFVVAASSAQANLFKAFFAGQILHFPFPVDGNVYYPETDSKFEEIGFNKSEEIILTYSGRISTQKNSLLMLKFLIQALRQTDVKYRFIFAGTFDDFGCPMWAEPEPVGFVRYRWAQLLKSLSKEERSRIHFVGSLNSSQLRSLYSVTDYFVSFSTFHDEDYGMAPLESLMCGSRAILTTWGGYKDFNISGSVLQVPVKLTNKTLQLDFRSLLSQVKTLSKVSEEERIFRSLQYRFLFGAEELACALKSVVLSRGKVIKPKPLFFEHATCLHLSRLGQKKLFTGPGKHDPLYEQVYRHYAK